LGAGAASTGAVGLFHVAGITPEAPTIDAACQGERPERTIVVTAAMVRQARDRLSSVAGGTIDCVAVGSPHFSHPETMDLLARSAGRRFRVPFYVCTQRDVLARLEAEGHAATLAGRGVVFVVDTCVVVTPILKAGGGVMMTSSAKFANYAPANTGYASVFGSLDDCIASAACGRVTRDESRWQ
jgi:predicted aconitase